MLPESYIKKCKNCPELQNIRPSSIINGEYWFPNLEELYTLVKSIPNLNAVNDLTLLSKLRIGIANLCCDSYLKQQSLYDFFIMFYMKMIHDKEWNESRSQFL